MGAYYKCRNCNFKFIKIMKFQNYCCVNCREEYKLLIGMRRKQYILEATEEIK